MSQGTERIMHLKSEYPEQKYRNLEYIETSICLNGKSMLFQSDAVICKDVAKESYMFVSRSGWFMRHNIIHDL